MFGFTAADQFCPLSLKSVRDHYVVNGWSRGYCNKSTNRIRHVWKWGVENGMANVATLQALHAQSIGLDILSQQIKRLPPELGRPLAAVNGDFYRNDETPYKGDPKGLQIMESELVSAPCDWSCFWIDATGQPHIAAVTPRLRQLSCLPLC